MMGVREIGRFLEQWEMDVPGVHRRWSWHCRTVLQSRAGAIGRDSLPDSRRPANAHPTLALV